MSKKKDLVGSHAWAEAIAANQKLICTVDGCEEHRYWLSPLCNTHRQRYKRNGSPHQPSIKASMYLRERHQLEKLWSLHRTNPSFIAARQLVDGLLYDAEHRWTETLPGGRKFTHKVPGRRILLSLIQRGIEAEVILTYAAAMFLYAERNGLFATERSLPALLGKACVDAAGPGATDYLKGRKLYQVFGGRHELGEWMRDRLLKFFVSQTVAIKRYEDVLQRQDELLGSFSLDSMSDHEVLGEILAPPKTDDSTGAVK